MRALYYLFGMDMLKVAYELGLLCAMQEAHVKSLRTKEAASAQREPPSFTFTMSDPAAQKLIRRAWGTYRDSTDPAHGQAHVAQVIRMAQELAKNTRLNPDHVVAAATLHDIAREWEKQEEAAGREADHAIQGAAMAEKYLKPFSPRVRKQIQHAIREHRASTGKPRGLLAKIISDADKLPDVVDRGAMLKRFVEYRRARGIPNEQIPEDARARTWPRGFLKWKSP